MNVLSLFNKIKLICLDVDGVLTNGSLLLTTSGDWLRQMNIKDGFALQLAVKKGYHVAVISGSFDEGVEKRLKKLGVTHLYFNIVDKKNCLEKLTAELGVSHDEVLFMGDDLPDMQVMQNVGLACCPADAAEEIRAISHYLSNFKGGEGCVRDVIRKVLSMHGNWAADLGIASR